GNAEALEPVLKALGMQVSVAGEDTGAAAAIKMVRSVMVKGMEAHTYECFVAAARAGVEDRVIASLAESFPNFDWARMIEYNLEPMGSHGARRAAQSAGAARTLRARGLGQ